MDIRTISSSGYNFWENVEIVSVSSPETISEEVGDIQIQATPVGMSTSFKDLSPNIRVSVDD